MLSHDTRSWAGVRLLAHLTNRLDPGSPHLPLNLSTTHALIASRPSLLNKHTMRVAQLAAMIAAEESTDPARASFLTLWHDTQETRTGDLPHTVSGYFRQSSTETSACTASTAGSTPPATV